MKCYVSNLKSPIGNIELAATDEGLVYCASTRESGGTMEAWIGKYMGQYDIIENDNKILIEAKNQLKDYFAGKSKVLDVPVVLIGTDFRIKVWNALKTIPYGETRTYGQIAHQVGNPKGPRAIGQANHHNPVSYFVP